MEIARCLVYFIFLSHLTTVCFAAFRERPSSSLVNRTHSTQEKCSKDVMSGTCCNSGLPDVCEEMLEEIDGKSCRDVVVSPICTACCSELFDAGYAASKEACCPSGNCGDTIGCKPVAGSCSCQPISYFSGLVSACYNLGDSCNEKAECCEPLSCIGNLCAKCSGRNFACFSSEECCGTDVCINNKCSTCSVQGMSCVTRDTCCRASASSSDVSQSCVNGFCTPCVAIGGSCHNTLDCCNQVFGYCAIAPGATVGVCSNCMFSEDTAPYGQARCENRDQCCGTLVCIQGSCTRCVLDGEPCYGEDTNCCNWESYCAGSNPGYCHTWRPKTLPTGHLSTRN